MGQSMREYFTVSENKKYDKVMCGNVYWMALAVPDVDETSPSTSRQGSNLVDLFVRRYLYH